MDVQPLRGKRPRVRELRFRLLTRWVRRKTPSLGIFVIVGLVLASKFHLPVLTRAAKHPPEDALLLGGFGHGGCSSSKDGRTGGGGSGVTSGGRGGFVCMSIRQQCLAHE